MYKSNVAEKLSEQDDELSAVKIDLSHNNQLLEEENKRLAPLRDRRMENSAKLQKLNLEMTSLDEEETRIKNLQIKLQNALDTLDSDLQREKRGAYA